jgi:hypothetical protein
LADTERWAVILWTIAMVVAIGKMLIRPAHSVYPNFAWAASRWIHAGSLYTTTHDYDYRYSPAVAISFIPLVPLGLRVGGAVWCALNGTALLAAMFWWLKRATPRSTTARQRGIIFLLLLPLAIGNIATGQSNALLIAMLLAAIIAADAGMWTLVAVLTTIAFLCKLYPVALGLLLILVYPSKLGWRLPLALAVGLLAPYLLQHPTYVTEQYRQWIHYLGAEDRGAQNVARAYRDLQFVLQDLRLPISLRSYRIIEMVAAAIIGLVCINVRLKHLPRSTLNFIVLTLAVCWMTVLGPATEAMTYLLVAPVICWLIVAPRTGPGSQLRWLYAIAYLMLLYPPFAGLFGGHSVMRSPRLKSVQPVAVLLLLAGSLIEATFALQKPESTRAAVE